MWRARPSKKGWHILGALKQLATESTPLPLPKSPAKSNALRYLKILGFGLPAAAGSLLGYAWYDPNFRQQLQANIPYAKEILEGILPESDTATPPARKLTPKIPASFEGTPTPIILADVKKASKGFSEIAPQLVHMQTCQTSGVLRVEDLCLHVADHASTAEKDLSVQAGSQLTTEKIDPSSVETQLQRRDEDDSANNAALEALLHKLLANSQMLVSEAVKAQAEAASSTRHHTELLRQVTDNIDTEDSQLEAVAVANREREQALLKASEKVLESKKCVEKLQDVIQEGKNNQVTQNNPVVIEASRQLNEFLKELGSVSSQVRQAEAEANLVQKYKELVDKGRKQFQKEIESLVPVAKLGQEGKLSEDELNILIAHSFRRVEQLEKQILELQSQEQKKLNTSIEIQKQEDLHLTEATIFEERQHIRDEFEHEKSKLEMDYLAKLETEVRKQLARQAAAHSDHLKEVLVAQKQELTAEYSKVLQCKLLEERERFQTEVAGWISRLKGIDAVIEARAASEKLTRGAQNLWLSCVALNSLITFGSESGDEKQPKPLRSNVEAILEAANQNPFVQTVVENFPDVALDRGISTEEQLKDRFYRVTRICRRLGLVDTINSSLYRYMVSYLHSLLILDNCEALSETDEVDLNALDTFAILAHAKYWMEKGHMDHALRFMIQLHGESSRAASDWISEARLFLETKQIVRTLLAYASASGLANTF
ncbi:hypothetical protein BsWGS_05567 [Bradybaena similaris]